MKDSLLEWEGSFPYNALSEVKIAPTSTMQQIKDAGFDLMAKGMSQEERAAWDELRLVERRLVIDFFLYQTDTISRPD